MSPPSLGSTKRKRVSRACDQCRTARERCDGVQPECSRCSSQQRRCTYEASPKKRGVQTGYIRALEFSLGWIFESIPGSEDALDEAIRRGCDSRPRTKVGVGKDAVHRRWVKSPVKKSIEKKLSEKPDDKTSPVEEGSDSDGDQESVKSSRHDFDSGNHVLDPSFAGRHNSHHGIVGSIPSAYGRYDGPRPEASAHITAAEKRKEPLACPDIAEQSPDGINLRRISPRLPTIQRPEGRIICLALPKNHWRLIDVYFALTHCWFPIVEKHSLLRTIHSYPEGRRTVDVADQDSGAHSELWAVLTLATFQNDACRSPEEVAGEASEAPDQLYNTAMSLVPSDGLDFTVQHVRALLLLSLVDVGRRLNSRAWMLIGKAVRMAFLLNLHEPNSSSTARSDCRAYVGCFILDSVCSIMLRLPPHIRPDTQAHIPAPPEDDLDEWQPWAGCSGFGDPGDIAHSRNPAHSITTFHQLRRIISSLSSCFEQGTGAVGWSAQLVDLKAALVDQHPFGEFLVSGVVAQPRPPAVFIARLTLLLGHIVFGTATVGALIQFIGNLRQWCALFGRASAPPILVAYISIIEEATGLGGLSGDEKSYLESFVAHSVHHWNGRPVPPPHSASTDTTELGGLEPYPKEKPSGVSPHHFENNLGGMPHMPTKPSVVPSQSDYLPGAAQGPLGAIKSGHQRPGGIPAHPGFPLDLTELPSPNGLVDTPPVSSQTIQSGGVPSNVDYDSLLSQVSTIESSERPDLDSQFMANLGFAPGSDLSEVLGFGFGPQGTQPGGGW